MFAEERQQRVLEALEKQSRIKVMELADLLEVSPSTIRRDLDQLEAAGLLQRTHGGALLRPQARFEPAFCEKEDQYLKEKEAIAGLAASMVQPGETIIIDAGTTTFQMLKHLREKKNLTIITNAINFAKELNADHNIELIMIGGTVRLNTQALVGPLSEANLKNFYADKAFIAANGCTAQKGLTTPNLTEAYTKRAMVQAATEVIALLDHSKFGQINLVPIIPLSELDLIITDSGIAPAYQNEMNNAGIRLFIA